MVYHRTSSSSAHPKQVRAQCTLVHGGDHQAADEVHTSSKTSEIDGNPALPARQSTEKAWTSEMNAVSLGCMHVESLFESQPNEMLSGRVSSRRPRNQQDI